jgi:hypothetical protein
VVCQGEVGEVGSTDNTTKILLVDVIIYHRESHYIYHTSISKLGFIMLTRRHSQKGNFQMTISIAHLKATTIQYQ